MNYDRKIVPEEQMLKDAVRGARNELKQIKKKENLSEVFEKQANTIRRRISIYAQQLTDLKNKKSRSN